MFLRTVLYGFIAGALAVPVFHQVAVSLLNTLGWTALPAFSLQATKPFGVPMVLSLSFWGGIWGILFALTVLRYLTGWRYWAVSIVAGAVALSLVAGMVVLPMKGQPMFWDSRVNAILVALFVNACWGLGLALFYRLLTARRV